MKNPNGFGTIDKLKGKRRRPYRARYSFWNSESNSLMKKTLGYFAVKKEAFDVLIEHYNNNSMGNNYKDGINDLTLDDIYTRWSKQHFKNISDNTRSMYCVAYNHLKSLKFMIFKNIKLIHWQNIIDMVNISSGSKRPVKSLINLLYRYAMLYELVDKDYSKLIVLEKVVPKIKRKIFTNEELDILWKNKSGTFVGTILIMIYTGMRIGELLILRKNNINFHDKYVICGIKTKSGIDRLIPLNNKIVPIMRSIFETTAEDAFFPMKYNKYRLIFNKTLEKLSISPHTIHDCRHTFASLLSNANANATSIKSIMGHSSFATTEKIYIHKEIEELRKAIDLL